MKNLIIACAVLLTSNCIFSQTPVTDATANSNLLVQISNQMKQFDESVKQTNSLIETKKFMEKTEEYKERVNQVFKEMKSVQETFDITKETVSQVKDLNQMIVQLDISDNAKKNQLEAISVNIKNLQENVLTLKKIVTKGVFKMSDSERLNLIDEYKGKIGADNDRLRSLKKKYEFINAL